MNLNSSKMNLNSSKMNLNSSKMNLNNYLVITEKTNTGYSAYVPDLPGCITVGLTKKDIELNIQEAILLHLEGMQEDGADIPIPNIQAATMSIA
jgi:predicted RNase H-like HicB family nuclease